MKCEEFEGRLQDLLDRRVSPNLDEQLDAHVVDCVNCRRLLLATSSLLDGVALNDFPEPSESFTDRVIIAATTNEKNLLPRSVAAISMLAVVAALLLVAVLPGLITLLEPTNQSEVLSNNSGMNTRSESNKGITQTVPPGVDPEDETYGEVNRTNAEDELSDPLIALNLSSLAEASQQINSDKIPGVRPIRSSFTVAFDLIRRTFPGGGKSESTAKPQAGAMRELPPNYLT